MKIRGLAVVLLAGLLLSLPAGYDCDHFAKWLFATAFVHSLAWSVVILWLIHCHKRLIASFFTVIYLLFFLETASYLVVGARINETVMTIVMQTNFQEAWEFARNYLISWRALGVLFVACVLYVVMIRWVTGTQLDRLFKTRLQRVLAFVVAVGGLVFPLIPLSWTNHGYNTVAGLYHSVQFVEESHSDVDRIVTLMDSIRVDQQPETSEAPVIVLVIGESFNKYHSPLYGYDLPTTPRLCAEKNLVAYDHACSPVCFTHSAMRYIISLQSCDNHQADDPLQDVLFPAIFKQAGYRVGYFDNQFTRWKVGFRDYTCGYFMSPQRISERCFDVRNDFIDRYDGVFVERCQGMFLMERKSLNIIHLYGQHLEAKSRYPETFAYFKGTDIPREDLDEEERQRVAEYDNATRYHDEVLGMIMDAFREQDAVLVYLSDHGDNIFDGPSHRYGRLAGGLTDEESKRNVREIPFMIWCSDRFVAKRPAVFEEIKLRAHLPVCLDDVAHLLFDLGGITSNYSDPARSLLNSAYHPHTTAIE